MHFKRQTNTVIKRSQAAVLVWHFYMLFVTSKYYITIQHFIIQLQLLSHVTCKLAHCFFFCNLHQGICCTHTKQITWCLKNKQPMPIMPGQHCCCGWLIGILQKFFVAWIGTQTVRHDEVCLSQSLTSLLGTNPSDWGGWEMALNWIYCVYLSTISLSPYYIPVCTQASHSSSLLYLKSIMLMTFCWLLPETSLLCLSPWLYLFIWNNNCISL